MRLYSGVRNVEGQFSPGEPRSTIPSPPTASMRGAYESFKVVVSAPVCLAETWPAAAVSREGGERTQCGTRVTVGAHYCPITSLHMKNE